MKKIVSLSILFLLLMIPINIKAGNEGIKKFKMDITVLENGDVRVKEAFALTGRYNGFERILGYQNTSAPIFNPNSSNFGGSSIHNASGIELINIKATNSIDDLDGKIFKKVVDADKGEYGVYTEQISYQNRYMIYNPSQKKKVFYLEYIIKDAVIIHNDLAELGWNIFGNELVEDISDLEITIHIPNNKNLLNAWAHGPSHGYILIKDINTVNVSINNLSAKEAIDVRLVFDKDIFNNVEKQTNVDAFDKILKYEQIKADEANQRREEYQKIQEEYARLAVIKVEDSKRKNDYDIALGYTNELTNETLKSELVKRLENVLPSVLVKEKTLFITFTILKTIIFSVVLYLIRTFYKKYDKEHKSTFVTKYYRDFPSNNDPEVVGYLLNKCIQDKDLSAAILNLINKKIIKVEEIAKNDYRLDYNEVTDLKEKDKHLIKFLFNDNTTITLKEIKKNATKSYSEFITNHTEWKQLVLKECESKNFFENVPTTKYILIFILLFVSNLFMMEGSKILFVINIVINIIGFIYVASASKRSVDGNEEYLKWMGLKKFMEDFGQMDKKDLPELILWEKYLVYAVALKCADKLANTMKIRVSDFDSTMIANDITYGDILFITSFNRIINSSINSSISSATNSSVASGSNSSGGGFGGGFSSGGGSFGGGGGGGRF